MSDKQILVTSPEAAKFFTGLEGWVDGNGRFWGKDEHAARWSGCTHIVCPGCGKTTAKTYTHCPECREKSAIARYEEKEQIKWDGKTPLYSQSADRYFMDSEDLDYYLEEEESTVEDLRLIICVPNYLSPLQEDFFCEDQAEDGELPQDVIEAMESFNEVISKQEPISWSPGKYAADLS